MEFLIFYRNLILRYDYLLDYDDDGAYFYCTMTHEGRANLVQREW